MDLAAFGPDDEPVLLVEVNRMLNATPEWAARFRQNMIDHGRLAATKFFLFALPDRFFLWQGSNGPSLRAPDYIVDAHPLLAPYFERAGVSAGDIASDSFQLLVASWLGDLLRADKPSELLAGNSDVWLVESGLHGALVGGHFEHGVPV